MRDEDEAAFTQIGEASLRVAQLQKHEPERAAAREKIGQFVGRLPFAIDDAALGEVVG